jgi:hypothetical protein
VLLLAPEYSTVAAVDVCLTDVGDSTVNADVGVVTAKDAQDG